MTITLPPSRAFRKISAHENGWSDHYGALLVAAAYAGETLADDCVAHGVWQHGVFGPWTSHSPGLLVYNAPGAQNRPVWVAREDEAQLLRRHGYVHARAMGMPILYTPPTGLQRQPGSLLVMPGHTLGGWRPKERTLYEQYADEIVALAPAFARVVICVSPRDKQNGIWTKEFSERGFEIIEGADTRDANALMRIRMLCEQVETITTNCWGSHVAYGLAFGAKLAIRGAHPTIDAATIMRLDRMWRADPSALEKARSAEVERQQHAFLKEFYVDPREAAANRGLGEWLIGSAHRVSPEQMRVLLPEIVTGPPARPRAPGAVPSPRQSAPVGDLPVVLIRSHEHNYSETFVEDHVNHLTKNLTLLYGYPFPRFLKGGRSVLSAACEQKIAAIGKGATLTRELWEEYSAGLAGFFRSCGARVALVETGLMGAFVHEACEQARLPFVVHFHGLDAFGRDLLAQWGARYRKFFGTATHVVAVSKAMETQLVRLGASPRKVLLAPYGVAVDLSALAKPAEAPPHFVAVGRFVEKKGPQLTLQAFAAVRQAVPEARLVMVGDGPLLDACRKWTSENGLSEAVTFAGVQSREQVSAHMAAARVFVQHSLTATTGDSEGLPLAVLEAGAHGLPVVSTRHAGIPDAVREGVDGFLVVEKDVAGMAAAMLKLARDPAMAARFGAAFRTRVQQHYSRKVSLDRLLAILEAAAAGRPYQAMEPSDAVAAPAVANSTVPEKPAQTTPSSESPSDPRHRVAADRNDIAAYVALGQALLNSGELPEAYGAIAEAQRIGGETAETRDWLKSMEEQGVLGEPSVEAYRRRAGWLPRRKSAQPRRILMVTNLLPPQEMGGYGRTMWEFGRELVARGHTVRVLTSDMPHLLRKPTPDHAAFEPNVQRTLRLIGDWKNGVVTVEPDADLRQQILVANHRRVLDTAAEFRPEIVIAGNVDFLGHSYLQDLLDGGTPVLHRLGNAQPGYAPEHTPRSPHYCIAGCSNWVNENVRAKGFPVARYAVLPPGSPLTEYYRLFPPQRDRLRIAFASLLMPYKGAHVLVEALAHLQSISIDFTCTLAGDTTDAAYVEKLRAFADRQGFADRLSFPGFLSKKELAALYGRSNVLVFPSVFEEPFGKTQIEAMAAGLAVVSSGNGGARDIIREGETGLFFKNNDSRDLASKLVHLQRNPKFAAQLASAGQTDAFRFTTAACVDRLESILQELIASARRGARKLAACTA